LSCKPARVALFAAVMLAAAAPVAAQSADDVFNSDVLHDVRLRVNARDWDALKRNFQLDTRYPANFTWAGTTVRDVAIRSRGFGSRNGTKPGLEIAIATGSGLPACARWCSTTTGRIRR
jgi:spore coat protein CotH